MAASRRTVALACLIVGAATAAPAAANRVINGCVIAPEAQCAWMDLRGADLHGENLWHANLHGADLNGADLHGAQLEEANLGRANLDHANLESANLWHADLTAAYLDSANFYGADLLGAGLEHTHAVHARFDRAQLQVARFAGANLQNATFHYSKLLFTRFEHAYFHGTDLFHAHAEHAHLWPSNFDKDLTARGSLFLEVRAHINAYGEGPPDRGSCYSNAYLLSVDLDSPSGTCKGEAEGNGTDGFRYGDDVDWKWSTTPTSRTLELTQASVTDGYSRNPTLRGIANGDWASYEVLTQFGFGGHGPTRTVQSRGMPGGPLAVYLVRRSYNYVVDDDVLHTKTRNGYVMNLTGWLPR
ncbi:MAG: pentapeptide repeat-containing protein [Solirubrobacteraceae bacterium]